MTAPSYPGISVVIATLGGESLSQTIDVLMQGDLVPREILICIPAAHAYKAAHLVNDVVKVITTEVKGQVKQRAYGFSLVQHPLVVQLDDDILLEPGTLLRLAGYLFQLGSGNAIAPVYYNRDTHTCIHALQNGFVKNCFDVLVCGAPWGKAKMGVVTSIGLNYGVDDAFCKEELKQVDWLPGACVMCYKEDLVTEDFFPFTGKAYSEDIYQSYYRKQKGVSLWVATKLRAYIDQPLLEFGKEAIEKKIRIRRKYVHMINGPLWRLRIYEWFMRMRSKIAKGDAQ